MNNDQLRLLLDEAEAHRLYATELEAQAKEEQRQRRSFSEAVDVVSRTRGGSRAFTLVSPVAQREVEDRGGHTHYGYCPAANGQGFHWRGGLYFRRDHAGNVVISDWRPILTDEGERVWTGWDVAVIDPDSWASIIASVSVQGETGERWEAAKHFHNDVLGATSPAGEEK